MPDRLSAVPVAFVIWQAGASLSEEDVVPSAGADQLRMPVPVFSTFMTERSPSTCSGTGTAGSGARASVPARVLRGRRPSAPVEINDLPFRRCGAAVQ
jgi:hypothetical protein